MAYSPRFVEFFKDEHSGSRTGKAWLLPCFQGAWAAGLNPKITSAYTGEAEWLSVMGIGDQRYFDARKEHFESNRPVACWDMGYFGKSKELINCYCRVSLNADHPTHAALEATEPRPSRWAIQGIALRDDFDPDGHVVVVGMGPKSHDYIGEHDWEQGALERAQARFPHRRIVYRPKPRRHALVPVRWHDLADNMPIMQALKGASLVICRHSNVAIDACIAGVPVECEAGAAHWLYSRTPRPSYKERVDFLQRLAWWQYRLWPTDMERGWKFLVAMEKKLFKQKEIAA